MGKTETGNSQTDLPFALSNVLGVRPFFRQPVKTSKSQPMPHNHFGKQSNLFQVNPGHIIFSPLQPVCLAHPAASQPFKSREDFL